MGLLNMNGGAVCLKLAANGIVTLKNVKTLAEITETPAGVIYKDASNNFRIV